MQKPVTRQRKLRFQSTPPSGERSDVQSQASGDGAWPVSIHAPLRREERRSRCCPCRGYLTSFNPRPPPERGATFIAEAIPRS